MKPFFFLFLTCTILSSCQSRDTSTVDLLQDNTTHFSGSEMTMDYHIIVGQTLNQSRINEVKEIARKTFDEIDTIYNKWNPNSELSCLNRMKASIQTPISPALECFFQQIEPIVKLTQGRFDPTIEPLQQLWKENLQKGIVPSEEEVAAITPAIGWDKISFQNGMFVKFHDLTKIDLGGIAKGLCVDLLVERLNEKGYQDTYVEWGGEIRASGKHPNNRFWKVFISRLGSTDPDQAIATISLDNQAIATSGDYLQNWKIYGSKKQEKASLITYFHIFDPRALRPLESSNTSVASASVTAPSCWLADALATSVMMFSTLAEAENFANEAQKAFPEVSFWLSSRE